MYKYTLLTLLACLFSSVFAQQTCNGYTEYCNQPYNNLTYLLTHNSYALTPNIGGNQVCGIVSQLNDGVRALRLSAVRLNDTSTGIQLCHTSCSILNAGTATDGLRNITQWIKANPNEVITISWNVPNTDIEASAFVAPYQDSGLIDYAYVQAPGNLTWPTLQEMVASNKRVVNFVDYGSDQTAVPWLMNEFDYIFETPYNNFKEEDFSCVIDRPSNPANPQAMMYAINHFLYGNLSYGGLTAQIPQQDSANVTNSDQSLLVQAQECSQTFGRKPNFLIVDFFNLGNPLEITATLNGVTYSKPSQYSCASNQNGGSVDTAGGSAAPRVSATVSFPALVLLLLTALVMI